MAEGTTKKRGPKKLKFIEPKAEEKKSGLPTTGSILSPELVAMLKQKYRSNDGVYIIDHLKGQWSAPVIRNLLKHGYCTDPALWNAVAKWFNDRSLKEKAAAKEMADIDTDHSQALLALIEAKHTDIKDYLKNLIKEAVKELK